MFFLSLLPKDASSSGSFSNDFSSLNLIRRSLNYAAFFSGLFLSATVSLFLYSFPVSWILFSFLFSVGFVIRFSIMLRLLLKLEKQHLF